MTNDDGKQWISRITLDPQIEWVGDKLPSHDDLNIYIMRLIRSATSQIRSSRR